MRKPDYTRPAPQISIPVMAFAFCMACTVGAAVAVTIWHLTAAPV